MQSRRCSNEMFSTVNTTDVRNTITSSDDESAPVLRNKKRMQQFSDSDSENEDAPKENKALQGHKLENDSDTGSSDVPFKSVKTKSRIQMGGGSSDSDASSRQPKENNTLQGDKFENDSDSETGNSIVPFKSVKTMSRIQMGGGSSDSDGSSRNESTKNEEQQTRMKNKRNKMKAKFKGLLSSREKHSTLQDNDDKQSSEGSHEEISDASDSEMSSIAKIKQKIKKSMASMSSICDPDTSDEEGQMNKKQIQKQRPIKPQKSTKLIEAKPARMSAKQAMENMQLIKSESNRMLREKAVSLPYHRPKALSLKDIMSRRKPAVALDGKALPIKMNEEQLKHYALLLEQRQKEMMELCKSESDEEMPEAEEKSDIIQLEAEQISEITYNKSEIITEKTDSTVECAENEPITNKDVADNDLAYTQLIANESAKTASTEGYNINSEEVTNEKSDSPNIATTNQQEESEKDDSNTDFKLVYNDSVEEEQLSTEIIENVPKEDTVQEEAKNNDELENNVGQQLMKVNTEPDSQLISLHYTENNTEELATLDKTNKPEAKNNDELENNVDQQLMKVNTEPDSQLISLHYTENNTEELATLDKTNKPEELDGKEKPEDPSNEITEIVDIAAETDKQDDFFSDDEVNMEDIDRIIENAEILKDDDIVNSPMLIRDPLPLNAKPTLTGAPGMVIDLDGGSCVPKKTGVELLKERFTYFARLKTPEEIEREKEKKLKPGAQHLKLKHELEEKIAEQRSLEWAKRLEEEKQQHMEMETILDDAEDSFEKIEGKLEEEDEKENESSSESEEEEEPEENDIPIEDKPRKHNPMLDDEAEESDIEENEGEVPNDDEANEVIDDGDDNVEQADNEEDDSSDDESSESEEEETSKPKKGRILKAFEDSDDEDTAIKKVETDTLVTESNKTNDGTVVGVSNEVQTASQDDVIQLAQRHASVSDDLFTSQESTIAVEGTKEVTSASDEVMTQTFSILDSTSGVTMDMDLKSPSKLNVLCMSQPYKDPSLNGFVEGSQLPITQSSQSQAIGEDILALCTGKFYDNEFVSPAEGKEYVDDMSQDIVNNDFHDALTAKSAKNYDINNEVDESVPEKENENKKVDEISKKADGNLLKDMLDELDDPEFDKPKVNKFFTGGKTQQEDEQVLENTQMKKKFTIDSDDDDEATETNGEVTLGKKKKLKKKKPEKRALQISDDEDEEQEEIADDDEYMSDLEDETERLVEYDSEENEIEVKAEKPKKKRKVADFFEQEAELTSEDEWVGSGDEDEKGLDRMEREEGDDEVFHQGQLRKELGQIHMRDVLDQDKREVRIIQELLFEDGDLGDGHRQRKFRWRNAGEEDATGTVPDEFADTQEEEFESEEQWRKQRHEREVFLRTMQEDEEKAVNVSVNRTTIIKANLSSKSMSTLLQEVNQSKTEAESPVVLEKKTAKDIPSPQKSFSIFQQNYHGSLLTRGRGALARLAALATPLAADDDAPKIGSLASHKRNFVFTALTQKDGDVPKVTIKRKADTSLGTPKLVKKMKIEEKLVRPKSSLLDHF